MEKMVRKTFPKQIADSIEEEIRTGVYQIGDKLPPEPQLVEMFGVSRNTVREAVQSLIHSGLLESRQGDGTYVVAKERLQVEFFNIMNTNTYKEVREVRDMLEKQIVVSAIRNRTDEDIRDMEHCLTLRKKEVGSIREASAADLNFHMAIAAAAHNQIVLNIYRYVAEYFNAFIYKRMHAMEVDETEIDQVHELLFQAIRDRDMPQALDCVKTIIGR